MKAIISFALLSILLAGCDLLKNKSNGNAVLSASFSLTDTTGKPMGIIHPSQQFDLSFLLINTTADTITFHRGNSGPSVTFQILKDDSIVATSVDGYAFLQVVLGGFVAPHDTLRAYWKAPTTPAQNPIVTLYPGSYEAKVLFPTFDQVNVNPVSQIEFSVVPYNPK